jgi:arabinose-5-phosphate isomerase
MNDSEYAASIIKKEAEAVAQLQNHIDGSFLKAVELCRNCGGNIIVSGAGKSGFVARKMAATLASLGVSSWWLHPNDAEHGDIGRVSGRDVCILFSYSGGTKEVTALADRLRKRNVKIIAITGKPTSLLATLADVVVNLGEFEEAGLVKLIPTSSTTASLAMSDALALAIVGTDLKPDDFGNNHPGGTIGLRLSTVDKVMRKGEECVIVTLGTSLVGTILDITTAGSGAAIVTDEAGLIVGVMTDGDLRRYISDLEDNINKSVVDACMTKNPVTIHRDQLVEDALVLFKQKRIGDLPVVDSNNKPLGMINLKDLTRLAL